MLIDTERKIGCDRNLPCCHNCQRSNRPCKGYGLKLSWPDVSKDGRRKSLKYANDDTSFSSDGYTHLRDGLPFLNTTVHDLEHRAITLRGYAQSDGMLNSLSLGSLDDCDQATLLSYYENMLSRMITTVDDADNGFRSAILPLALSSKNPTSQSLLQATLSLAALHLGRPDVALKYKLAAIKSLSRSLNMGSWDNITQLATCMMLCVNGVSLISVKSLASH